MSFWQSLCCQSDDNPSPRQNHRVLQTYENGSKYSGEQLNNQRNGYGVFTFPNEDQYEGQWLKDMRHGRGKMLYNNGDFFMGEWVEDRRQGRGLHVFQDMSKYEGEWKADLIDGIGKLIDPDGSYYEGQFSRGQKDGRGTYYNRENKKKYNNVYKGGELQICELVQACKEQPIESSHRENLGTTIIIDQPKVTDEDIKIYQNNNPELKDVQVQQLQAYFGILKIRQLPFSKINPKNWKINQVVQWLKAMGLSQCQNSFEKNKVSGAVLIELTEEDLKKDLSMKLGERKRFSRAMIILKNLHNAKIKKEKRTLKHLKNYRRTNSVSSSGISPPSNKTTHFRTPKSLNKFVESLKNDPIVEENAQNQDHDDSPAIRQDKRLMMSPKKMEKLQETQTLNELNYETDQWNSYNTQTLANMRKDVHRYESLNINDDRHMHSQRESTQRRDEHEFEEKEQQVETQLMEELQQAIPVLLRKQTSKHPKKKQDEQLATNNDNAALTRKQPSKKNKALEEKDREEASELDDEGKKIDDDNDDDSSSSSQDSEEHSHNNNNDNNNKKRKKSRDQRPMEMRELYEYLKDHHISMNFLIPENQITNMEQIGEGGYGKVYKAKWMSNPVAVKTYLKAGRIHRQSLDDFLKEVEILNNLRHPNVVLYMGMCIQISRYSLITEYLEQGSLFDQLHKKHTQLSTERIYEIVEDIVLGMVYLHAKNILHRDLKSSNVLIGDDWKVKLCDFGLSEMHSKKKMKVNKARIGTYQWMAPEVLRKQKNIGFKADVYSFGMVLWELLTHKIPFEDYMPAQIEGLVGYDETFKMSTPEEGDPFLVSIMQECLQKDPNKRPSFFRILEKMKVHEEAIKPKLNYNNQLVVYSPLYNPRLS